MFDGRGRLSIFRIAIIGAVIGIVLIIGGVFALNADQNSRRGPLIIDPYPGAVIWGDPHDESDSSVSYYMRVPDAPPETVAQYYQQRLADFSSGERCVRTPGQGDMPVDPSQPNSIPYRYDCLFDRSSRNATQYTRISIFPEMPDMDPYTNFTGTIIYYIQVWQP